MRQQSVAKDHGKKLRSELAASYNRGGALPFRAARVSGGVISSVKIPEPRYQVIPGNDQNMPHTNQKTRTDKSADVLWLSEAFKNLFR